MRLRLEELKIDVGRHCNGELPIQRLVGTIVEKNQG